jgi:hypothetical protein
MFQRALRTWRVLDLPNVKSWALSLKTRPKSQLRSARGSRGVDMPEPVSTLLELLVDKPVVEPLALSAPAGMALFKPVLLFVPMLAVPVLEVALDGLDMSLLVPVFEAGVVDLSIDELPVVVDGIVLAGGRRGHRR